MITSSSKQTESNAASQSNRPDLACLCLKPDDALTIIYMHIEDDKLDLVEVVLDRTLDLVQEIYDNGHARRCPDYRPFINKHGMVFCDSCGITVGSIKDDRDETHCRRCDHQKHIHHFETGKCGICGNECGPAAQI